MEVFGRDGSRPLCAVYHDCLRLHFTVSKSRARGGLSTLLRTTRKSLIVDLGSKKVEGRIPYFIPHFLSKETYPRLLYTLQK